MNLKRFITIFTLLPILCLMLGATPANAQAPSPAIIESYTIENVDGTDVTKGPLMSGATYSVNLEINVGVNLANNTLVLTTPMIKVSDVYWQLKNDYAGINTGTWQPGQASIKFNVVKGVAQINLRGAVPSDYTSEQLSNGEYLHFVEPISLVELSLGPTGTVLDECTVDVIDQAIVAYQQTIRDKKSILQAATTDPNDADPKYVILANNLVKNAESLSSLGYVEEAKSLLDALPSSASNFPMTIETAESAEDSSLLYIIIIVIVALLLFAVAFLFLKSRSGKSFILQQVDEEAGKLDVLSVKVVKMDKQLASELEQVKDQLHNISGR